MNQNNYGRTRTLDIESKNDEKVFIKIPLETGGFWQREYLQNDIIQNVVDDFKEENHFDIPQDYFMDWNFKNKSLKMTDKIKTLINQEIPTVCINQVIKKKPLQINKEELLPDVVGKPFNDPFEVFVFTKLDKSLKIQTYDPSIVNNLKLCNYSPSSAYCNGNNHLFISGGETKDGELIDNFWEIDLTSQNIAEPVQIPPKKDHSMIFIPDNYVFVVGGDDKKTFYFNTENGEICEWADLNNIRREPALERISNNLYCFDNINKGNNDVFTVEKTDLTSNKPLWHLLAPKMNFSSNGLQRVNQKFFGVSKDEEDNIIFLGGNMDNSSQSNELSNYKYNISSNAIEMSKVPYRKYNFKEKTFLTYNKNVNFILPDFNKQHPEVVFYVKNKNKLEPINYEPKFNSHLKSLKPPMSDYKYDFNMPIVAIPDPISDFNLEGQNIQTNVDQQNQFYSNIKLNDKPPSIKENNMDDNINNINISVIDNNNNEYIEINNNGNNNNINNDNNDNNVQIEVNNNINNDIEKDKNEQQTDFKEPEIEPVKNDMKLSVEIPKNVIENNSLRNRPINNNFGYINNYEYSYMQNIPKYQDEIYLPKFHHSVNDPGNELIISSKGGSTYNMKIINYQNNFPNNINSEYKIGGNIEGINTNMPKNEGTSAINLKEAKNANNEMSGIINGTGTGIKIEGKKTKDFTLTGTIHGSKSKTKRENSKNKKDKSDFKLVGKIPGVHRTNTNSKDHNIKIDLKGPNPSNDSKSPKINVDLKSPSNNFDFKDGIGTNINGSNNYMYNSNVNVNEPKKELNNHKLYSANINAQKIEFPSSRNNIDFNLNGNIPPQKGNNNLKNSLYNYSTNINNNININLNLEGSKENIPSAHGETDISKRIDYNLTGRIQGTKPKSSKKNIPKPNKNTKLINNYDTSGLIPGYKNDANFRYKSPKNIINYNELNGSKSGFRSPKINLSTVDVEVKGPRKMNSKTKETLISGIIPGKKRNQSIEIPSPNIKVENPQINEPDINLKGTNPNGTKIDVNVPNINNNNNNSINVNLRGPKIETNNNIPQGNVNSPNINLNEIKIPDYNIKGTIHGTQMSKTKIANKDTNISGIIPGHKKNPPKIQNSINTNININNQAQNIEIVNPNINMPSTKIEPKDININENINANLPQVEVSKPNINLQNPNNKLNYDMNGTILGTQKPNIKLNTNANNQKDKPDFFISGLIPSSVKGKDKNININYNSNRPDLLVQNNNNLKGASPMKKSFHGNLNDPFYEDTQEIKGSRRGVVNPQIDNVDIPRISKNSLNGSRIQNDINLQEPYNLNSQIILQAPPKMNNNDTNLILPHMQIQPENKDLNNIQIQRSSNEYYPSEIENNKNENKFIINNNADNNIIDNPLENNINNDNNNIINSNNNNNINFDMPKVDVEINNNFETNMPKIDLYNKPKNNNNEVQTILNSHKLTDLRFKPIEENYQGMNDNNTKNDYIGSVVSGSQRTNSIKKNKELPLVGKKTNDFKSSKIEKAGKLYTNDIDVNNMKSANVGVNGVKIGDRIIE